MSVLRAIPPVIHGVRVAKDDLAILVMKCDNCRAEFVVYAEPKVQRDIECEVCGDLVPIMPRLMEAAWDRECGLWSRPEDVRVLKSGLMSIEDWEMVEFEKQVRLGIQDAIDAGVTTQEEMDRVRRC